MVHYLDHAATTPVRPDALEVMVPLLTNGYGNPSGAHRMARSANAVLDDARETMADALGAEPGQIVFTAGGTEADNLAIYGAIEGTDDLAVCSAIEHHAVLDPVTDLDGVVVPVDAAGVVDLEALREVLVTAADDGRRVGIVSIMAVNNEVGVMQPLDEVAAVVREHAPDALLHTDAVQSLCWIDVASACAPCDLVSVSAHKFGGPKGVGALVVRDRATLTPRFRGGGQERGRRGGTQNVAGIAAMATAAAGTVAERAHQTVRIRAMRDRLVDGVTTAVRSELGPDAVHVTAADSPHTPNIAHLCFDGVENEALLFLLEKADVMASAASSCSSGAMEPSHVLAAMGLPSSVGLGSLRLSLGYASTDADVDAAIEAVPAAVARLREMGS